MNIYKFIKTVNSNSYMKLVRIIFLLLLMTCPSYIEAGPVTNPLYSYMCYNIHHDRKKCPKCSKRDNMDSEKKAAIIQQLKEINDKHREKALVFEGIFFVIAFILFGILFVIMCMM